MLYNWENRICYSLHDLGVKVLWPNSDLDKNICLLGVYKGQQSYSHVYTVYTVIINL